TSPTCTGSLQVTPASVDLTNRFWQRPGPSAPSMVTLQFSNETLIAPSAPITGKAPWSKSQSFGSRLGSNRSPYLQTAGLFPLISMGGPGSPTPPPFHVLPPSVDLEK